jgi:F-box-like
MQSPAKRLRRSLRLAANLASQENPSPISNLPTELLIHILSFNAPTLETYYRWTWMDRMAQVCTEWNTVAQDHFKPKTLYLEFLYYSDPNKEAILYEDEEHDELDDMSWEERIPFLESFLTCPGRTDGIYFVMLNNTMPYDADAIENETIQTMVRRLFCTPGILPDLAKLALLCNDHECTDQIVFGLIDSGTTFKRLATAHPKLDYLYLDGCFPWSMKISPAQWAAVCSTLGLETLILGGATFLTDSHLEACATHLANVHFLCLDSCGCRGPGDEPSKVTDKGLVSLSKHCNNLHNLALKTMHNITEIGLEALLRANPNIEGLDLESSHNMTVRASTVIRQYAPKLTHLKVLHSDWFTDEALTELVGESTSTTATCSELVDLNIRCTQVTPSGLRHVLATNVLKANAAIDIGYSSEDLKDATLMRPGLEYATLAQLVNAEDLEILRSTVEARKAEWLCLSLDYGIIFSTRAGE